MGLQGGFHDQQGISRVEIPAVGLSPPVTWFPNVLGFLPGVRRAFPRVFDVLSSQPS